MLIMHHFFGSILLSCISLMLIVTESIQLSFAPVIQYSDIRDSRFVIARSCPSPFQDFDFLCTLYEHSGYGKSLQ